MKDWPYLEFNVKDIIASSFLTETLEDKKIEYSPLNMRKRFFLFSEEIVWIKESLPCVEGKPDEGINEYLNIYFDQSCSGISILNGYVDLDNKDLYLKPKAYGHRVSLSC